MPSLMHLQSSSAYSDALHIGLHMLCNSTPPPASAPPHVPPPLVCLFVCLPLLLAHVVFVCLSVSPSGLFPLIDGQWTSAKSNCTLSWYTLPSFLSRLCLCPAPSLSPSNSIQPHLTAFCLHLPAFHCLCSNSKVYLCNCAMSALRLA